MKRIVSVILAIIMAISPMVYDEQSYALSINCTLQYESKTVTTGQTFDYSLDLTQCDGTLSSITFANLISTFENQGFKINSVKPGALISESNLSVAVDKDTAIISGISVNKTGSLLVINLTAPNNAKTVSKITPSVADYQFSANYSGIMYKSTVGSITIKQGAAPTEYTVKYDANGGSGAPDNGVAKKDTEYTIASTVPTWSSGEYDFVGWSTSKTATSAEYQAGKSYTITSDLTLYAVWKQKSYYISFDANGGTGAPNRVTKTHGQAITLPTDQPTKTGYVFIGWGTSASATTVSYYAGGSYNENKTTTLYAIYSIKNYYIRYDLNGGTSATAIAEQGKTHGTDATLSSTVPTRTGYDFLGWATSKTATSAAYSAGGKYTTDNDVTLYAVWKVKTYNVTFDANGGTGAPATQVKDYFSDLTLSSTKPTRTGYDFQGWATSKTATSATYSAGAVYKTNAALSLYAVWKLKTYSVSYDANGGSGAPSAQTKKYFDDLTLSSTKPTRTGYDFLGWATTNTATSPAYQPSAVYKTNAALKLYAVWQLKTYTVSYDANGGTGAPSAQTKKHFADLTLSSTKPTRTGYTFQGWTKTQGSTTVDYAAGAVYKTEAGVKLYAVWKANTYKVTFDANGGTGAPTALTKTHAVNLTLSSTKPTRTGYTFQGWAKSKTSTTVDYLPGAVFAENNAVTLYAVWKINTYTVKFDANGGTGAPAAQTKTYGKDLTITSSVPTRDYYTFVGWGTSKTATTATIKAGGVYKDNKDVTYYAIWKRNTYTVRYNYNLDDGETATGSIANQTKNEGEALTLSATIPTRKDYKFIGWSTDFEATAAEYSAGSKFTVEANTVLFAVWVSTKIPTYTVTYDANGGSYAPAKQTKVQGEDLTITDVKAEKTGYEFIGWNTDKTATKASVKPGSVYSTDSDLTLYAIYREPLRESWDFVDGNWFYYDANNKIVTDWQKIAGIWYYFHEDGVMATGWTLVNGTYFYMDSNGHMQTGWQKIGNHYYYFNANGYMVTGWLSYAGKWYYLSADGNMVTGWVNLGGKYYYMNANGEMQTGWVRDGKEYYYMNKDGQMVTGWVLDANKYYYMKSTGEMAKGWVLDGNYYYYLNGNGEMQTGWVLDGKTYYYMNKDGQMVTDYWLQYANQWYYFGGDGSMATGWKLISGKWYFFDKNGGSMVAGKTIYTDGRYYTFNSQGVCLNP